MYYSTEFKLTNYSVKISPLNPRDTSLSILKIIYRKMLNFIKNKIKHFEKMLIYFIKDEKNLRLSIFYVISKNY